MSPVISIIVPVYKADKFLKRCVDSILAQTFTDFECILIDDGSPDSSPAICDEYAKKDPRVKVIHQKNGGVSAARNAGLDAALGEWIGFVDSDDWIEKDTYEVALNAAVEQNADIVQWQLDFPGSTRKIDYGITQDCLLLVDRNHCLTWLQNSCYTQLFNKKIIDENRIRFPLDVSMGEDRCFSYCCIASSSKVWQLNRVLYHYFQNEEGICLSNYGEEKIFQDEFSLRQTEKFLKQKGYDVYKKFRNSLFWAKFDVKNHCYTKMDTIDLKLWRAVFPEINFGLLFIKRKIVILNWLIFFRFDNLAKKIIMRLRNKS